MQVGLLRGQENGLKGSSSTTSDACIQRNASAAYIWHALNQLHGVSVQSVPKAEHAGSFVVPATVFPSPKLQPGAAVLSTSLAASLGRPAPSSDLMVYPWPAAAQLPPKPSQVQSAGNPSQEIYLQQQC